MIDIIELALVAQEVVITIQDEASEILGATSTPLGLVTGTLIAGSKTALAKSKKKRLARTAILAFGAAVAAVVVSVALIFAMWDVMWRSVGESFGAVLLGYWIAFCTVVGVAVYSAVAVLVPAAEELRLAMGND